jgi:glutamyl-tRNA synthetase
VLRGDDHLTNTPRQILILRALALRVPGYGHVGLLVGADGAPLSKRHGSTSVQEFRERGFLRDAVLNQLFRLGHASDVDGWLPLERMAAHFRADHLGRAPARFDDTQLIHWQKESLARLTDREVSAWLGGTDSAAFEQLIRHNVVLPGDAAPWRAVVRGNLAPFGATEQAVIAAAGADFFRVAIDALRQSGGDLKALSRLMREHTGLKGADLFMPLRLALTGQAHGPELAPLLRLIPLEIAQQRLETAFNLCSKSTIH